MNKEFIFFEGLLVEVYRNDNGKLTVSLDTSGLEGEDVHNGPDAIPNLAVWINDGLSHIEADGSWVEMNTPDGEIKNLASPAVGLPLDPK